MTMNKSKLFKLVTGIAVTAALIFGTAYVASKGWKKGQK